MEEPEPKEESKESNKIDVANIIRTSIIIFLILLTLATIGISALDIILNAAKDHNKIVVSIAGGSYFLTGIIAVILAISRLLNVKRALNEIPKSYVPIRKKDLSESVYKLITSKLAYVYKIRNDGKPRPEDGAQPGWGISGSSYDNIHFRSSIIETFSLIEQQAVKNSSFLERHPSMSVQLYINLLIERECIDRELGHAYVEGYEHARFSNEEVLEVHYTKFMKIVIQLLRQLGFDGN